MVLLLSLLLSPAVAGQLAAVELKPGSVPAVELRAVGAPVLLPACRGVVWEIFDGESQAYLPVVGEPCAVEQAPREIGQDPVRIPAEVALPPGAIVRAVVVVASGCLAGEAVADAGCTDIEVLETTTTSTR